MISISKLCFATIILTFFSIPFLAQNSILKNVICYNDTLFYLDEIINSNDSLGNPDGLWFDFFCPEIGLLVHELSNDSCKSYTKELSECKCLESNSLRVLLSTGFYQAGEKDGMWIFYEASGKSASINYKKGVYQGSALFYNYLGVLKYSCLSINNHVLFVDHIDGGQKRISLKEFDAFFDSWIR